jgi:hypothetical protein
MQEMCPVHSTLQNAARCPCLWQEGKVYLAHVRDGLQDLRVRRQHDASEVGQEGHLKCGSSWLRRIGIAALVRLLADLAALVPLSAKQTPKISQPQIPGR